MLGFLLPQMMLKVPSRDVHLSALFFYSVMSLFPIGSSFWMFYQTISLLLSDILLAQLGSENIFSLIVGSIQPMLFGSEAYWSVLEIFVPLTGRLGNESPAENIIAIIVTLLTFMSWPLMPAYIATLSARTKKRAMLILSLAAALAIATLSMRNVWDAAHPRRLFVQYMYNVSDSTTSLHFASADPAPDFRSYLDGIASRLELGTVYENQMTEWLADWDTVCAVHDFISHHADHDRFTRFHSSWTLIVLTFRRLRFRNCPLTTLIRQSQERCSRLSTMKMAHEKLRFRSIASTRD